MQRRHLRSLLVLSAGICALAGCATQDEGVQTAAALTDTVPAPVATAEPAPLLSNERQLTFEGLRAGEGYFSADGSKLVFQSEREADNPFYQIYLMDLETGDVDRISPGHGKTTCAWVHPSNQRVLFASTHHDPQARQKQADEIAFRESGETRRYEWDYDPAYELYEFDETTGDYEQLTDALGYDAEGAYSPDGTRIVFASNRSAYERDLTDEEQAQLELDPAWFMDVYVMDADGSNVQRLTDTPGYDGGTFWSPDGSQIIWRRFSEDGARAEVYTMNADGTGERQITDLGVMSWAPIFHPSGDYIIFSTNLLGFNNFELYIVDAKGLREPVRVSDREGFDGLPMFHPDGDRLAWTSNNTSAGVSQIFLADWNDDEARRLLGLSEDGTVSTAATGAQVDATLSVSQTTPDITAADLKLHVAALASEAMEGRLTGTAGERMATRYVADAFAELGLQPAGDQGEYFQSFDFTAGVSLGEGNELVATGGQGAQTYALNESWRPLSFSRTGAVEAAPIVFAGWGLVAPEGNDIGEYDSYAHLDVEGKWVLMYRGLPNDVGAPARTHYSRYSELRYKTSVAQARGAAGVIFAPAPDVDYRDELPELTYESSSGASGIPAVGVNNEVAGQLLATTGADIAAISQRLHAGEMINGLEIEGVTLAGEISLEFERRTGRNVVARLDLGAPDGAPPVVIGAHVDHLGRGETSGSLANADETSDIHFGADDNASGVAALIEIAQNLSAQHAAGNLNASRDVVFAAWSGEELGLLGASHFTTVAAEAAGQEDLTGVYAAYFNMDMIGRLEDSLVLQGVGSSGVWTSEIERRNAVVGLPITTVADTYLPTDATEFYIAGIPILSAFTGAHEDYHSPRDTPDKLNYEGMEQIATLMSLIVRSQAVAAEPPEYIEVANEQPRGRVAGVFLGTIPDYATEDVKGVAISGVVQGGPAAEAGLIGGDVIVGLGGVALTNIYDYMQAMNGLKVDEPAEVIVERDGERIELTITPSVRE